MSEHGSPNGNSAGAATSRKQSRFPTIEESRALIIESLGESPNLTFVRPFGNLGDQLIWAGVRSLLSSHVHREIGIDDLPAASGEVALIAGGGAWRRRRLDYMPEVLAVASRRFEHVVVLPSSFEVGEDRVRRSLSESDALVFAREPESFRQIQGVCRALMAHDCAFFADLEEFATLPAEGTLNAFRRDDESAGLIEPPIDNEDISESRSSLDEWLRRIAAAEVVNTDRAHVMIAAARMGRRVNFLPNSYFKVEAIAQTLSDFNVHPHPAHPGGSSTTPPSPRPIVDDAEEARVEIHLLTRDDAERASTVAAATLRGEESVSLKIHDRNSGPVSRTELTERFAPDERVRILSSDRDIGIGESIRLAAEQSGAEFMLFLTSDMRPEAGSIARLVEELETHPDAVAVAPMLVGETGAVESCGGWPAVGDETYDVIRAGRDCAAADVAADPQFASAETGWIPLLGSMIRRSALVEVPLAADECALTQNADWCLRVQADPTLSFRATAEATIAIDWPSNAPTGDGFRARSEAMNEIAAHARFFKRHDVVIADRLGALVPELRDEHGEVDIPSARLLLKIVNAEGRASTLIEWMNGGLAPLLGQERTPYPGALTATDAAEQRHQRIAWLEQRNEMLSGIEAGGWWRLRERFQPLRNALAPRTNGSRSES